MLLLSTIIVVLVFNEEDDDDDDDGDDLSCILVTSTDVTVLCGVELSDLQLIVVVLALPSVV